MSDVNYNIAPVNPIGGYMQALQMGNMIGGMRSEREQAQAQAEAQRLAAEQKAMKDAQIAEAYEKVNQEPTAENYATFSNLVDPEKGKSVREAFSMYTKDQQEAKLAESVNLWASLVSGQPDIAIKFMEDKIEGYKAGGNEEEIKKAQTFLDLAKSGEAGLRSATHMIGTITSMMPGGKEAMDAYNDFSANNRAEDLHPLNKAKLQAEIDAFDEKKKSGGLDAKAVSDLEVQLNNSVNTRLTGVRTASTLYENIKASAEMGQGEGDRALVNMFSRMLSPGIVTASDYAAATSSGGIMGEFSVLKDKVATGDLLTPKQREKFVKLAKEFYENAKKESDQQLTGINSIVKTRGLNKNNVFGTPKESEPVEVVKVSGDR